MLVLYVVSQKDEKMIQDAGAARATGPTTSHAAASVKRVPLRSRTRALFLAAKASEAHFRGYTGHDLAALLGAPLNSVTPRLAELRRERVIKDGGLRENGQIVWVPV